MKIQDLQRLSHRFYRVLAHVGMRKVEYWQVMHTNIVQNGVWMDIRRVIPKKGNVSARELSYVLDLRNAEIRIARLDERRISVVRGKMYGGGKFTILLR